jgi:hypothetical protein
MPSRISYILKMEVGEFSEMMIHIEQITGRHVTEDSNLNVHRHENLKLINK